MYKPNIYIHKGIIIIDHNFHRHGKIGIRHIKDKTAKFDPRMTDILHPKMTIPSIFHKRAIKINIPIDKIDQKGNK